MGRIEAITIIKHKKYELFSSESYFTRKADCLLPLDVVAMPLNAQREAKQIGDFKESISLNEHLRGTKRTLQYRPDGDEFVCVNGKNRYTRALYGSHSPFRVETSDRPVFAFYNNGRGGNISFKVILRDGTDWRLTAPGIVNPVIRLENVPII